MAQRKVAEMDEMELRDLQDQINARMGEIQKEKNKGMMKEISIGKVVLYSKNGKTKNIGIINIITEDYVGVKGQGEEGKKNRRIQYQEIEAISDKAEDGWIV